MKKNLNHVVAAIFSLLIVSACGDGKVSSEWREEVKLSSGELIIVKRTAEGTAVGELGGPGTVKNMTVTVIVERSKTALTPPPLSFRYVPVLFDYDMARKEWFVVATFYTCSVWYELRRPRWPYLEYRVRNGAWEQVELDKELFGRSANMLIDSNFHDHKEFVSLSVKHERNKDSALSSMKILENWRTTC